MTSPIQSYQQLTNFSVPVRTAKFHIESSTLAFTAQVYYEVDSLQQSAKLFEQDKSKIETGIVYGIMIYNFIKFDILSRFSHGSTLGYIFES